MVLHCMTTQPARGHRELCTLTGSISLIASMECASGAENPPASWLMEHLDRGGSRRCSLELTVLRELPRHARPKIPGSFRVQIPCSHYQLSACSRISCLARALMKGVDERHIVWCVGVATPCLEVKFVVEILTRLQRRGATGFCYWYWIKLSAVKYQRGGTLDLPSVERLSLANISDLMVQKTGPNVYSSIECGKQELQ